MGSLVKGVIIHELLLIQDHATASFLCKLLHSNLHIGISYSPSLPDSKVGVLQKMAMQYYSDCFPLNNESAVDGFNKITLSWGDNGGKIYILFLTARNVEGAGACKNSGVFLISKLEESPLVICGLNRKSSRFYVLGEQLLYAVRKSRPYDNVLTKSSERSKLGPFLFDSLKSLPISTEHCTNADSSMTSIHSSDLELVTDSANWLARKLDLTIFGFDVVVSNVFLSIYLSQSPPFTCQGPG
uniref:Uncharacterized protein n=1 Tax=Salix viminalis TaxID=40686 RepID=A0A6N2LPA8_SALVM